MIEAPTPGRFVGRAQEAGGAENRGPQRQFLPRTREGIMNSEADIFSPPVSDVALIDVRVREILGRIRSGHMRPSDNAELTGLVRRRASLLVVRRRCL